MGSRREFYFINKNATSKSLGHSTGSERARIYSQAQPPHVTLISDLPKGPQSNIGSKRRCDDEEADAPITSSFGKNDLTYTPRGELFERGGCSCSDSQSGEQLTLVGFVYTPSNSFNTISPFYESYIASVLAFCMFIGQSSKVVILLLTLNGS